MAETVLRCEELTKTYTLGFLRRKVEALRGATFSVERGEIFGFLGPNGAGKTTAFKILVGLLTPSGGRAELLGAPVGAPAAKRRMGFLPENPLFYEYLTATELLNYVGRLFGLDRKQRRLRAGSLLETLGMSAVADRALRYYSKGMLQRVGIAQALMGDPELVILDEPMTGLDPIGRKELREFIGSLRGQGKTVVFSTHILPDVELLCDRVAILYQGRVRDVGALSTLVNAQVESTEVVVRQPPESLPALLAENGLQVASHGTLLRVIVPQGKQVNDALEIITRSGGQISQVTPRGESLEDYFVRTIGR